MNIYKTPRLLWSDAYTLGSYNFESKDALDFSKYYLTFRKGPNQTKDWFGTPNDGRILVAGISYLIRKLFSTPITMEEIEETRRFLKNRKATTQGLKDFNFPKDLWIRVVNEFRGYPPLRIEGLPEGSVAYAGEPVLRVYNTVPGFGVLAAYFEAIIINYVWSATTRLTFARHWLEYWRNLIAFNDESLDQNAINFLASIACHDFGYRAAMTLEESEHVAMQHLYCFTGTDTFGAAYQAWKNGALPGTGTSVDALAHRVVQGFKSEMDCYDTIYDMADNGDIISMVADCYDYKYAVEHYLLPLAKEAVEQNNNKVIVARPDSGDALEQILWTCKLAEQHGLFITNPTNGLKSLTALRIIEGDSMTFQSMIAINSCLIRRGWAPWGVLIYGVGGSLRNNITRDLFSTKYALCSVGTKNRPVIKKSEVTGKQTLPDCKVIRSPESLTSGITIVDKNHSEQDVFMIYYYNGMFGDIMKETFDIIQQRVLNDFDIMPVRGGLIDETVSTLSENIIKENTGG